MEQSGHVETVCQLVRQTASSGNYVEIGVDAEEYHNIKDKKNS